MRGLMMDTPLLISSILRHADLHFPDREIVSVTADNPQHRYTYAECFRRTRQLARQDGIAGDGACPSLEQPGRRLDLGVFTFASDVAHQPEHQDDLLGGAKKPSVPACRRSTVWL